MRCLLEGWVLGWLSVHELGVLGLIDDGIHRRLELFALALGQLVDGFFDLPGDKLSDLITRLIHSEDGLVDEFMDGVMHIMGFHISLLLLGYLLLRLFLLLLGYLLLLLIGNLLLLSVFLLLDLGLLLLVFSLLLFFCLVLGLFFDFGFHFLLFFSFLNLLLHVIDRGFDLFWILSASRLISFCFCGGIFSELLSDLGFDILKLFCEFFLESIR